MLRPFLYGKSSADLFGTTNIHGLDGGTACRAIRHSDRRFASFQAVAGSQPVILPRAVRAIPVKLVSVSKGNSPGAELMAGAFLAHPSPCPRQAIAGTHGVTCRLCRRVAAEAAALHAGIRTGRQAQPQEGGCARGGGACRGRACAASLEASGGTCAGLAAFEGYSHSLVDD